MIKGLYTAVVKFVGRVLTVKIAANGYLSINGKRLYVFSTAVTGNTTLATGIPANSFAFTTHATGGDKIFRADGTKWQVYTGA
jgi:hypothetical protein